LSPTHGTQPPASGACQTTSRAPLMGEFGIGALASSHVLALLRVSAPTHTTTVLFLYLILTGLVAKNYLPTSLSPLGEANYKAPSSAVASVTWTGPNKSDSLLIWFQSNALLPTSYDTSPWPRTGFGIPDGQADRSGRRGCLCGQPPGC